MIFQPTLLREYCGRLRLANDGPDNKSTGYPRLLVNRGREAARGFCPSRRCQRSNRQLQSLRATVPVQVTGRRARPALFENSPPRPLRNLVSPLVHRESSSLLSVSLSLRLLPPPHSKNSQRDQRLARIPAFRARRAALVKETPAASSRVADVDFQPPRNRSVQSPGCSNLHRLIRVIRLFRGSSLPVIFDRNSHDPSATGHESA